VSIGSSVALSDAPHGALLMGRSAPPCKRATGSWLTRPDDRRRIVRPCPRPAYGSGLDGTATTEPVSFTTRPNARGGGGPSQIAGIAASSPSLGPLSRKRLVMARMPIPQPWFRTPEDYEAIRHLVTDEPQLFDTFEEWLDAADKRFEKFIAKGITVKKVFVDPQEFTAWCSATNVGHNRASFLAFAIAASTKQ
jgi:hypothetical protein